MNQITWLYEGIMAHRLIIQKPAFESIQRGISEQAVLRSPLRTIGQGNPIASRFQNLLTLFLPLFPSLKIRVQPILWKQGGLLVARTLHDTKQAIVITCTDGIKLVVVTARATHRQSLKGLADDINLVVQNIQLVHLNIHRRMDLLAQPVKTRSEDGLIQPRGWIDSWMRKLIPSKMFHDELIIRKVLVDGSNDVIPIAPGVGDRVVKFMPHGLRIAHQIQPVTRPMLSIVNGTQQRFDDLLFGIHSLVLQKRVQRCLGWRKTRQDDVHSSQPSG